MVYLITEKYTNIVSDMICLVSNVNITLMFYMFYTHNSNTLTYDPTQADLLPWHLKDVPWEDKHSATVVRCCFGRSAHAGMSWLMSLVQKDHVCAEVDWIAGSPGLPRLPSVEWLLQTHYRAQKQAGSFADASCFLWKTQSCTKGVQLWVLVTYSRSLNHYKCSIN